MQEGFELISEAVWILEYGGAWWVINWGFWAVFSLMALISLGIALLGDAARGSGDHMLEKVGSCLCFVLSAVIFYFWIIYPYRLNNRLIELTYTCSEVRDLIVDYNKKIEAGERGRESKHVVYVDIEIKSCLNN